MVAVLLLLLLLLLPFLWSPFLLLVSLVRAF
jgi:hypothetical protein